MLSDGHENHWIEEVLKTCDEEEFDLQLRVPHSSHRTQGCDTDNFRVIKPLWQKRKAERVAHNLRKRKRSRKGKLSFDFSDCMATLKLPWQHGFRKETCKRAWRHISINPFTRCVYWDVKAELEKDAAAAAAAPAEFQPENVDWCVIYGEAFSDTEDEDEEQEGEPKVSARLTSGDLIDGPVNAPAQRAKIEEKKKQKRKAIEDAKEKAEEKEKQKRAKQAEAIQGYEAAVAKLEKAEADLCKLTVNDLRAIVIHHGHEAPLGAWSKPAAIEACKKALGMGQLALTAT